jgi:hypothetical protein
LVKPRGAVELIVVAGATLLSTAAAFGLLAELAFQPFIDRPWPSAGSSTIVNLAWAGVRPVLGLVSSGLAAVLWPLAYANVRYFYAVGDVD